MVARWVHGAGSGFRFSEITCRAVGGEWKEADGSLLAELSQTSSKFGAGQKIPESILAEIYGGGFEQSNRSVVSMQAGLGNPNKTAFLSANHDC